jgi:hypothetical protein
MCVDCIILPLGFWILIGSLVIRLLRTGQLVLRYVAEGVKSFLNYALHQVSAPLDPTVFSVARGSSRYATMNMT